MDVSKLPPEIRKLIPGYPKEDKRRTMPHLFKKGNKSSKGRPIGSRSKFTMIMEDLLFKESEKVMKCVLELAVSEKNTKALEMCMDRLYPPRKGSPIPMKLPVVETIEDFNSALTVVIGYTTAGKISPEEGNLMNNLLESKRRAIVERDLISRVERLENPNNS